MARLWQGGAELNSVTNGMEVSTNSGTVSISSATVRSGTFAWKSNPTAATGFFRHNISTSNRNTNVFFRMYFNVASYPTSTSHIMRFDDTTNGSQCRIQMTSTGTLQLRKADGTSIVPASSALSLDTWYCIELNLDGSTSPGTIDARIDGVSFATGANSAQGSWARISWGHVSVNATSEIYTDDGALNDTTGSDQTSWPGSGKIIFQRPDATGDANSFAVQVGGTAGGANNFTRVNEIPPDDATSYNASAVLSQEDLFNCGASGINSYDTVNVVMVGGRIADLVAADATSAFKFEIEKTSGGTKTQSATIIPNSTTWGTNAGADPRTYPIITYVDPDGAAWTNSTLDSAQIGYTLTAINIQSIAVSNVFLNFDYTPGTPPAGVPYTLLMMGV